MNFGCLIQVCQFGEIFEYIQYTQSTKWLLNVLWLPFEGEGFLEVKLGLRGEWNIEGLCLLIVDLEIA